MSRKYNKKGETALLDDDSQSTQPSSSRRSGGAAGRSTKRQQPREEVVAPPPPEVEDEEDEEPKGFFSSKTNIIGAVVSVLVILAIIAGVAWFLLSENPDTPNGGYVSEWGNVLLSNVNRTAIQYNFDSVTGYTTLSGTIPSLQAVDFVHSSFLASFAANSTIATSTVHTYYALFNYPRGYDPNATNPDASAAMNSRRLAMLLNGTRTNASLAEAVIDMDPATKRNDAVPTCNHAQHITQNSTHSTARHHITARHITPSICYPTGHPTHRLHLFSSRCCSSGTVCDACMLAVCQSTATVRARMAICLRLCSLSTTAHWTTTGCWTATTST